MRLLVSVASSAEASAAATGGADVIDAKDPLAGALGAVSPAVLRDIHAVVSPGRLLTAALGDASDAPTTENAAHEFTVLGAALVKIGFAGVGYRRRIGSLIEAGVRGCGRGGSTTAARGGVVAVAYADSDASAGVDRMTLIDIAARAGAVGVLLDTADKRGAGLTALCTLAELSAWVAEAHGHRMFAALAGKLTAEDLEMVRDAGADIAGVRGAACEGGRMGRLSAERVRLLRARLEGAGITGTPGGTRTASASGSPLAGAAER